MKLDYMHRCYIEMTSGSNPLPTNIRMPIAPHVLSLGWSHYQAGNPAQAEQVFRQALDLDPDNADVWCLLGIVCRAQGHHAAAVASYREALKRRLRTLARRS